MSTATVPGDTDHAAAPDRRAAKREAKRAQILAAAWELAHRDGIGAISLRELAAMVDLRQPSLYAYFDSKDALYDAMFAEGNRALLTFTEFGRDIVDYLREAGFEPEVYAGSNDVTGAETVLAGRVPG